MLPSTLAYDYDLAEAKIIWPKHAAGCPALLLTQVHNIKFSPSIKQP